MKSSFSCFSACCESLETRLQFSGASDLLHSIGPELTSRVFTVGASHGPKALFAGGVNVGVDVVDDNSDIVHVYNSAGGEWSILHLSRARTVGTAVTVGGKTFFAGGSYYMYEPSAVVDVYDGNAIAATATPLPNRSGLAVGAAVGSRVFFAGNDRASRIADVLDPASGQWATALLPRAVEGHSAVAVMAGNWTVIASDTGIDLFDSVSARWTGRSLPFAPSGTPRKVAVSGSKAFFLDITGSVKVYDFVSRHWATLRLPSPRMNVSLAAVGSKVIFAGGEYSFANGTQTQAVDRVDVYDILTGEWSRTTLAQPHSLMVSAIAGSTAIFTNRFFGGPPSSFRPDLFTDTVPSPLFIGSLSGRAGGAARLTLFNIGDADLTTPYTVEIYASTDRTLKGAIPIGHLRVNAPLAAGASTSLRIGTGTPRVPRGGTFYLLAAVRDADGHLTPVAASETSFQIPRSSAAWGRVL